MNKELISKEKECKSAEETLALAKENGYDITEEQAKDILISSMQAVRLPMKSLTTLWAAAVKLKIMLTEIMFVIILNLNPVLLLNSMIKSVTVVFIAFPPPVYHPKLDTPVVIEM